MTNADVQSQVPIAPPPGSVNVETPARGLGPELGPMPGAQTGGGGSGTNDQERRGCSFVEEWKNEDLMSKLALSLRGSGFVFSLLSWVIMASNKQGSGLNFDQYEQYRYVMAIAVITFIYTGAVTFLKGYRLCTRTELVDIKLATLIDFVGDQVMAYLLMSSSSAGAVLTNAFGETYVGGASQSFASLGAGAVSMSFFAFFVLAISALISGYKLSTRAFFLKSPPS